MKHDDLGTHQVQSDGRTVWVNEATGGAIARVSRFGDTVMIDNKSKRGSRWLLLHCAICGDLLQRYDVDVHPSERERHGLCACTEQLQRCRRLIREDYAKKTAEEAARAASAPVTRPDYSDRDTQLGA